MTTTSFSVSISSKRVTPISVSLPTVTSCDLNPMKDTTRTSPVFTAMV
jgi:hypothetical protein